MVLQINIKPQQVPSSVTHDKLKSLRYVDVAKSSFLSVHVTRKWEELDFMSTNDLTVSIREMSIFERVVCTLLRNCSRLLLNQNSGQQTVRRGALSVEHLTPRAGCLFYVYSMPITPHNFCFTEFEALQSNL